MAKIKISCKHCDRPFIVDWEQIVMSRTAYGYREIGQKSEINSKSFEEISLDLQCPVCSKKASYRRSESEEV